MDKTRHRDLRHFRQLEIEEIFPWVDSVKWCPRFHSAAEETWNIKILGDIAQNSKGREMLEAYVRVYLVKKSIIFCWRHTEVIVIIFK